ncbi:MAG TPA: AAA family ATPase [Clostridia bacterium]|nr:AAA family ATPase [Clostridia bacterium]
MGKVWIVSGISGSGRRELLQEVAEASDNRVAIYDVGERMLQIAADNNLSVNNDKILDIDNMALTLLRAKAVQSILNEIEKNSNAEVHLVGIHAVFPWRGRIIPGISFEDIASLKPSGVICVVDDVKRILGFNKKNIKWQTLDEFNTQYWMMIEEYVSKLLSEFTKKPFFVVARQHETQNLLHLLLGKEKKRIYLSYPITAIKKTDPNFLIKLEKEVLPRLYEMFVVFNPLDIKDLESLPSEDETILLNSDANQLKKERTVERDYDFIDQSDAIVVFYKTDKHSPGVAAEIEYAHRNSKDVFMLYPFSRSPFLERAADEIYDKEETFWKKLKEFST